MGYHFLLQGIFLTQESNPRFLHYRRIPVLQADSLLTELWGNTKYMVMYPLIDSFSLSVFVCLSLFLFLSLSFSLWVKMLVARSCPTLCNPMGCCPPSSFVHGILQARIGEWVSHSLFQVIFPTQASNLGLLYCRQILYCLTHLQVHIYVFLYLYMFYTTGIQTMNLNSIIWWQFTL